MTVTAKAARHIPKARHVPTGVTHNANDITKDSPLKPGPWACATETCPVTYTNHRAASYAKEANAEKRIVRSATFVVRGEALHSPDCAHNRPEAKKRIAAKHPEVVKVSRTMLFLDISTPTPTHQQAVTRTKGHPNRKDPHHPQTPIIKEPSVDADRYKKVLRAARSMEKLIASYGDDPEALTEHQIRFDGRTFGWLQFCFGPGTNSLIMFNTVNEARGTQRITMKYRPFLVRGYVKATRIAKNGNPFFVLQSEEAHNGSSSDGESTVRVFAPIDSPADKEIQKLRSGAAVTVLSIHDGRLTGLDAPLLNIKEASQLFTHKELSF